MRVSRYKFTFVLAFCLAKLVAAYFYISASQDLDYSALFEAYCSKEVIYWNFDILNTIHFYLFRLGCSLGKIPYFWLFAVSQLILLLISFNKLYAYKFKSHKLLLIALYFSPTILYFSSAPTKDGFFVFITCLAIIMIGRLYGVFLLVSAAIKPYLLALYAFKVKSVFFRLLMITLGLLLINSFGEEILFLIVAKGSYLSPKIGSFSLGSFVWTVEILVILSLAISSRMILKKDITFVLLICILASGVSMNVSSRIFVISIFYLLALRLHANART